MASMPSEGRGPSVASSLVAALNLGLLRVHPLLLPSSRAGVRACSPDVERQMILKPWLQSEPRPRLSPPHPCIASGNLCMQEEASEEG